MKPSLFCWEVVGIGQWERGGNTLVHFCCVFSLSHSVAHLQALQVGHLALFFIFASHFSWWNYVSCKCTPVHVSDDDIRVTTWHQTDKLTEHPQSNMYFVQHVMHYIRVHVVTCVHVMGNYMTHLCVCVFAVLCCVCGGGPPGILQGIRVHSQTVSWAQWRAAGGWIWSHGLLLLRVSLTDQFECFRLNAVLLSIVPRRWRRIRWPWCLISCLCVKLLAKWWA